MQTNRPSRAPFRGAGALALVATVAALSVVTTTDASTPTYLSDVTPPALVLQTCEGSGTGFSLLHQV